MTGEQGLGAAELSERQSPLRAAVGATVQGNATGYVLVMHGGSTLLSRGFGSADGRIPAPSRETAFDIASVAKLFTAAAILRLSDQGRLDLESSVRRYLPELPATLEDVTLRHALQHDTGFPPYLSGGDLTQKSSQEVLAEIGSLTRDRRAGSGFRYSDVGYVTLSLVVERIVGKKFPQAMRQLVFRPAGLSNTGFYGDAWASRPVATEFAKGIATGSPATFRFTYNFSGSGQIATTVDDLHRLFKQLSSGQFLSPRSRSLLFAPGIGTAGRLPFRSDDVRDVTYGLGLFHFRDQRGRLAHGHGGATELGGHAFVYWRPADQVFVAALFNSGAETFRRGAFMSAVLGSVDDQQRANEFRQTTSSTDERMSAMGRKQTFNLSPTPIGR